MRRMRILHVVVIAALLGFYPATGAETRVLIIVGPSTHPPGTHEVAAGGRLMRWALENMSNVPGVKADIVYEWPNKDALQAATTIVFAGDTFPPQRMPDRARNLKDIGEMMSGGRGIICVHYATGLRAEDVEPDGAHPLLRWMGGYFATGGTPHHKSVAKVFQSVTVSPAAPEHPVSRGWRAFTVDDEPYYNNYFGPDANRPAKNVRVFATAMLPPEDPKREAVAWGTERADGGRGFGIVMPHFYKNWANEDLRRFILNAIVWTAKLKVPAAGVRTPPPDLTKFEPESVEPKPRTPPTK